MVKQVPYFNDMGTHIIQEICYLLKPQRFYPSTTIVKFGDVKRTIYFVKQGNIVVTVLYKGKEYEFETLPEGSCFCAFSAFNDQSQQLVNFKANSDTSVVVETIEMDDLIELGKDFLVLSDELKKV